MALTHGKEFIYFYNTKERNKMNYEDVEILKLSFQAKGHKFFTLEGFDGHDQIPQ